MQIGKMNPVVSIIVPVYNVEKYLRECINSVLKQSFVDWELVLVDDGSTDYSAEICKEYSVSDSRIRFFHKENTGVCDTRNLGIDEAKGKYIIFLDSDDYWVNNEILLQLVTLAETKHLDIVRAEYKEVTVEGKDLRVPVYATKSFFEGRTISSLDFLEHIVAHEFFLVLCLIRRECIGKLRFNTRRIFLEDAEFYLRLLQQHLKCRYLPIIFYAYRKHEGSVTVKDVPGNKKLRDAFDFTRLCFNLSKVTADDKMKDYLIKKGLDNYIFDMLVIGESKKTYRDRNYWFAQWNISQLHQEVMEIVRENKLRLKYKLVFFPLEQQLKYYRYRLYTKSFIKKILNKIFK